MTYIHQQVLPARTRLGVYEIKDTLKISPFSISYCAWNHHLNEQVVLYEYYPYDLTVRGEDGTTVEPRLPDNREDLEYGLRIFLRQAEILAQINHPNVMAVENALQFNGTAYLVVDSQEGAFLSESVHSSTIFTEVKLRHILVSMLNALQNIHENGVVHGGIYPGAIFLDKQDKPVLTDFAAARLALALRVGKLDGELNAGYAPKEQYGESHEPKPASDLYALGATMYHLITHKQPFSAPDRLLALSKNESDSMILHSSALNATYSANLLEAIDWMLCSEYQVRPQTAAEVLAVLASKRDDEYVETIGSGQKATDVANSGLVEKDPAFLAVMAGIVVMIGGGLWFGEKNVQLLDEISNIATDSTISQQHTNKIAIKPVEQKNEPAAITGNDLGQESGSEIVSTIPEKENNETGVQVERVDNKIVIKTGADNNQLGRSRVQASSEVGIEAGENSVSVTKAQGSSGKSVDPRSIDSYMAAAEKAMREMRYTTPVGNSAYENFQTVLVSDPNNAQALSGLQKIVSSYIRLIEEAQEEGQTNTARVYLLRAQAVLPDNARLQRIDAELNTKEVNH